MDAQVGGIGRCVSAKGEVMDEATIRAKAEQLHSQCGFYYRWKDRDIVFIEAAITAAHDTGWDERGEADAKVCAEVGRNSTKQVRKFIQAFPVSSEHIGQFFADAVKEIRRLRKDKP